jgi:fructose-1-phosphate kinase PfkB-like protein
MRSVTYTIICTVVAFVAMTSSTRQASFAHALSMMSGSLQDKSVVVGLNAAFQKRFILPSSTPLTPGSVHRADAVEEGLGGKGQDVAVTLRHLWPDARSRPLFLAQFIGSGAGGSAVMSLLESTLGEGEGGSWDALTVRCESAMRTCTSIIGSDSTTELVEPSGVVHKDEMDNLLGRIDALASSDETGKNIGAASLCIMGSLPPGCNDDTYGNLCSSVCGDQTLTVIDSVIGLKPLLSSLASKRGSNTYKGGAVLKINASELCRLAGVEQSGASEEDGVSLHELKAAVEKFKSDFAANEALDYMAITDGRHPAHLVKVEDSSLFRLGVVDLSSDQTLYPIGAGDSVAAGTLAAWLHLRDASKSPLDEASRKALAKFRDDIEAIDNASSDILAAFAFGVSCGSASCLQAENSVVDTKDVVRLLSKIPCPSAC